MYTIWAFENKPSEPSFADAERDPEFGYVVPVAGELPLPVIFQKDDDAFFDEMNENAGIPIL